MSHPIVKSQHGKRVAVLEVSGACLTLCLLDHAGDRPRLRWKQVTLEHPAAGRNPPIPREALAALLHETAASEKLQGLPLHVVLSGDYCVTRVLAGMQEQVTTEMNALRVRSGFYLSLGSGPKTFAESVCGIDAKRSHGALTVANEHTLTDLLQTTREAGLNVISLRHSLVSLCKAVGITRADAESPVLIVQFNQHGIELGVSYRGRLLLDYRPGGTGEHLQMAEVVLNHLGRIQRFLSRNFSFASGRITRVLLCGPVDKAANLRDFFATTGNLQAELLDPQTVCPDWQLESVTANDSWLGPALGALVPESESSHDDLAPDLMAPIRLLQRDPIGPALLKLGWPALLTAAATVLIYIGAWWEQQNVDALQVKAKEVEEAAAGIKTRQLELAQTEAKIRYWTTIQEKVEHPHWHAFLATLGECLPEGTWLETVKVDKDGTVYLSGPTYTEDSVYALVEKLKQVPVLANVALEATRSARLQGGPVTLFDLKASYVGHAEPAKGT